MELQVVEAELGLPAVAALEHNWDNARLARPAGELTFLDAAYVDQAVRVTSLSPDLAAATVAMARRIAASPPLTALAWYGHHCLYRIAGYAETDLNEWPDLRAVLGDDWGVFYLVVLLSGLPQMEAIYRARQLPADVFDNTLEQMRFLSTGENPRKHNFRGLAGTNVRWLQNHFRGVLYTLGRLQLQFGTWSYQGCRVFRHRSTGAVVALADAGGRFTAAGDRARGDEQPGDWIATCQVSAGAIQGHPIRPDGVALATTIELPLADWHLEVCAGQPVLNIHIPSGAPLAHATCGDSLRRGLEFFPRFFPDRPFVAICCGSWLLNGELSELLPADSNMVRFQREFHLLPLGLDPRSLVTAAFDHPPADLATGPRETTFQRALVDLAAAGQPLASSAGGCFLLPADLDWGAEVYRRAPGLATAASG